MPFAYSLVRENFQKLAFSVTVAEPTAYNPLKEADSRLHRYTVLRVIQQFFQKVKDQIKVCGLDLMEGE